MVATESELPRTYKLSKLIKRFTINLKLCAGIQKMLLIFKDVIKLQLCLVSPGPLKSVLVRSKQLEKLIFLKKSITDLEIIEIIHLILVTLF